MPVLTESARFAAWGDPCTSGDITLSVVEFEATEGMRAISVNTGAVPAFAALSRVFSEQGYMLDGSDTGAYNCRHIGNDSSKPWSAHAWAVAIDVNWLENPDGKRLVVDPLMPDGLPAAVEALETKSGAAVFRWGGNWDRDPTTPHGYYDAMHWEVIATPEDIASGIVDYGGNDMAISAERQDFLDEFAGKVLYKYPDLDNSQRSSMLTVDTIQTMEAIGTALGVDPWTNQAGILAALSAVKTAAESAGSGGTTPGPHSHDATITISEA